MRLRPLIPTVLLCLMMLVLCNLAMVPWSHRLWYHQRLDDIQAAQNPDVVFVGNSLMDSRIDTKALNAGAKATNRRSFIPLNASLGASAPPDQALLMHYSVELHPELHTLVVGFYDFQLTVEPHLSPRDLTGNHLVAVDHRFPVAEIAQIYKLNRTEQMELQFLRAVPMAANRFNAWKYVELLRRDMGTIGMGTQVTNDMGRVGDFSLLEASSDADFDRQADEFLRNPTHFNASYESVFADARQHKLNVVLVLMPMSPSHRQGFYARRSWSAYVARLQTLSQQRGFTLIDASAWMPRGDQFSDVLHMTFPAAREFSYRLGFELAKAVPESKRVL